MRQTKVVIALIAIIAITSAMAICLDSDDSNAANADAKYKLTYYCEIEGDVFYNEPFEVLAGALIPLKAPDARAYSEDYVGVKWTCNGLDYYDGDVFIMPDGDATLVASWEYRTTVAANANELPEDMNTIFLVLGAIFVIVAIAGTVVIQKMRQNALRNL